MSITIALTRGYSTVVDDGDADFVRRHHWHAQGRHPFVYAAALLGGRANPVHLYLHRELLRAPAWLEVDHINGDRLDNRRTNLRLATHEENSRNQRLNAANTSGVKGVCMRPNGRWRAYIKVRQRQIHLGDFDRIEEAAAARALAEAKYFGEFRRRA